MQAPSQHSHSAPAGCQQLNGWILWINLTLGLANFSTYTAGWKRLCAVRARIPLLHPQKLWGKKSHQRIILQLNQREHHFCCSKDMTFAAAYAYAANLLKKFQDWKSYRLREKVLRTRHAIVRSREKRQIVKVRLHKWFQWTKISSWRG